MEKMTKLEETNEMIKAASKLFCTPIEPDAIVNKNDVRAITLLDIAKSLAIIADGITTKNEHIEKIKSDIHEMERRDDARTVSWP